MKPPGAILSLALLQVVVSRVDLPAFTYPGHALRAAAAYRRRVRSIMAVDQLVLTFILPAPPVFYCTLPRLFLSPPSFSGGWASYPCQSSSYPTILTPLHVVAVLKFAIHPSIHSHIEYFLSLFRYAFIPVLIIFVSHCSYLTTSVNIFSDRYTIRSASKCFHVFPIEYTLNLFSCSVHICFSTSTRTSFLYYQNVVIVHIVYLDFRPYCE